MIRVVEAIWTQRLKLGQVAKNPAESSCYKEGVELIQAWIKHMPERK